MVTVQLAGRGAGAGVSVGVTATGGVVGSMAGPDGRGGVVPGDGGLGVLLAACFGAVDGVVDPGVPGGVDPGVPALAVPAGGAGAVGGAVGSDGFGGGRVMVEALLPLEPTGSRVAGITRMRPGSW
jgi:hypothetical protein